MVATRRPYGVVLPIVLIVGGAMILLANLGTLPEDAAWRLVQLWPLILVMLGVQLLVPHVVRPGAVPAVTLLLVGAIAAGAFSYALAGPPIGGGTYTRSQSTSPLSGVTEGTVKIQAAGAQVTITTRDIGSQLYVANVDYAAAAPRFSYENGHLQITSGWSDNVLNLSHPRDVIDLGLNSSVTWTISIDGAGVTTKADTSDGRLGSFTANGVGGEVALTAGAPDGVVKVALSGVGTGLTLKVPPGTEYRVTAEGIGTSVGGTAQTAHGSTATDRYEVSVNGVGAHATVSPAT